MRTNEAYPKNLHPHEAGQAAILVVLMLGTFLLGALAFAVDFSNMWFHRQSAQTAADAACLAGATDLLFTAGGGTVPTGAHFTAGTASNCASSSTAVMCKYAGFNGYNGAGFTSTTAGNSVAWTFPGLGTVAGATDPPTSMSVAYPYLKVAVTENVKTWFASLLGRGYQQVGATCTCGVQSVKSAPPLLILDPTDSSTFTTNNNSTIKIIGGPSRSIQANSTSSGAQSNGGVIDTSQAGPSYTGADVAIVGTESASSGFTGGTTGHWVSPVLPIPDPYSGVPAPAVPPAHLAKATVAYHDPTYNCPAVAGCDVYFPGRYSSKLSVGTGTALFKAGLYYMDADLDASGTGATMRVAYPGNSVTSQTDGVTFYFNSGIPKINGKPSVSPAVDQLPAKLMQCDATAALPPGVPTNLDGTALWGPCMTSGTFNGNPGDTLSNTGTRGLLMYYAHSNSTNPVPSLEGQGQMAFSGALYFHVTGGNVTLKLAGGSGSGTEILGQVVTDQLTTTGTGAVSMALNTKKISNILKVAMLE